MSLRAIWYGSSLALHTSDLHSLTVQQWVGKLLHQHKHMSEDSMNKEAFRCYSSSPHCSLAQQRVVGPWQLIIEVAAARVKRHNRTGVAYEAKSIQGDVVLQGITSCTGKVVSIAIQEAMIEAAIKARSLGFNHFIVPMW
uniref:Uncharacterized protein n=1 Tax=Quercus lobata TaxID=97700 RepID=A0A7N2R032_QUELO